MLPNRQSEPLAADVYVASRLDCHVDNREYLDLATVSHTRSGAEGKARNPGAGAAWLKQNPLHRIVRCRLTETP